MSSRGYYEPRTTRSQQSRATTNWARGPEWATHGWRQPGWILLPLRIFLGFTFTFAALQKLANPDFFNASSPTSVQQQMQAVAPTSPIGPLVTLSLHAGWLVGLLIALGELAVGVGALLGLKMRLAAFGGALLASTFFLTVSWNTTPYYYGADIVFLFAWTPFIAIGSGAVLSVDAWLAQPASSLEHAMTFTPDEQDLIRERRTIVTAGGATLLVAGFTALFGRLSSSGSGAASASKLRGSPKSNGPKRSTPGPHGTRPPKDHGQPAGPKGMTRLGALNQVPVGQAAQFQDPASGGPAWLVRLSANRAVAFSAVCTHAGCTVGYEASAKEFVCPCHGGTYSARSGQVLAGPPPTPLPRIDVNIDHGEVYAK